VKASRWTQTAATGFLIICLINGYASHYASHYAAASELSHEFIGRVMRTSGRRTRTWHRASRPEALAVG
jgi:hypothetical protein